MITVILKKRNWIGIGASALCFFLSSFTLFSTTSMASSHSESNAVSALPSKFSVEFGDSLGLSPHWNWKTIETPHFLVHFPSTLESSARLTASYLEEAHTLLAPNLKWNPRGKTSVLVVDNEDAANGLTAAALGIGMLFYITPPDNWFSTYHYDDWLWLLIVHEYTHFLNMDATRDFWEVLRVIFGNGVRPNALWPSWMLEGLAVYEETRLTHGGRGRSPYYEMILRAAVEAKVLDDSKYITLDKINGDNPYAPFGETAYLFGYQLTQQVAKPAPEGGGDTALGEMSYRSAGRFPYFINGNLENITGKDWPQFWSEWVTQTRTRMTTQLQTIQLESVTVTEPLTEASGQIGSVISPDGRWIAYNFSSPDDRSGLYLRSLKTGRTKRIGNKTLGIGMRFTPDSRHLIYSRLARFDHYSLLSDLYSYDLKTGNESQITFGLRARDPDLSADGKLITFTRVQSQGVGVALGRLVWAGDRFQISGIESLHDSRPLDRASTPRFSPDGQSVVFSLHKNGVLGESLISVPTDGPSPGKMPRTLVLNGANNRFPVFGPNGTLYFVSDLSGVDNLYSYENNSSPIRQTNFTTGVSTPTFDPSQKTVTHAYGNMYTYSGWRLSRFKLSPVSPQAKPIAPPPVPDTEVNVRSTTLTAAKNAESWKVEDYSVWNSLLPRTWAPILYFYSGSIHQFETIVGAAVTGFDDTHRHEYTLLASYNTLTRGVDGFATYSNRTLGPILNFSVNSEIEDNTLYSDTFNPYFFRNTSAEISALFPTKWTYSTLTPILTLGVEKDSFYRPLVQSGPLAETNPIPYASAEMRFSDALKPSLAVAPEEGRTARVGAKVYRVDADTPVFKGVGVLTQNLHLGKHWVLSPTAAGLASSNEYAYASAAAKTVGIPSVFYLPDTPYTIDRFRIRGYRDTTFYARALGVGALDLNFPIWQIYRGWSTNPFFLDRIQGFAFGELNGMYNNESFFNMPSAGGGIKIVTELLLRIPAVFGIEYQKGFNSDQFGQGEFLFSLSIGGLSF